MKGKLPNGWEEKKLGEVCIVERGSSPRPIDKYITQNANGVNWIKIGDTKGIDKFICKTKEKITPEGALKSRFVKEGDFIRSNSMSFGKPYIMQTSGYIHDGWFVLRLNKNIDSHFFYNLLTSPLVQDQFISLSSGAIVKNISSELVKKAILPIPPLPEQKRIVAILDEAFSGIARAKEIAEKNLANAKEIFESYLQSVFSNSLKEGKETTIGETTDLNCGFAFKSDGYTNSIDGIKLLRGDNIVQGALRWDDVKKWPANQIKEYSKFELSMGDIILAMDRPWVSAGLKRAMIQVEDLPCLQVQRTARLRAKPNLDNSYLLYIIESKKFIKHILGSQTGLGVPHISGQQIQSFSFKLPPISEQRNTVDHLNQLRQETQRLECIYQQKLTSLESLKRSLLHQAFTGAL